jgi:spermidine synthase
MVWVVAPIYSDFYERLVMAREYVRGARFAHTTESRTGVVTITREGKVFGGGVYDGFVSTDLGHDVNGIFRAYAVSALHPRPADVLMIGLSMGAWAQVIANNTQVSSLTIVEIDSGYLKLIPRYAAVRSLLRNPKVHIVLDDGRRWLARNAGARFDLVVANTSQHWLAHSTNLLSVEFLSLVRSHLNPGGVYYYNTTFSGEAFLTGLSVFSYGLRVGNLFAVSDTPIAFDKQRLEASLRLHRIDGIPVADPDNPANREAVARLLALGDTLHDDDATKGMRIESGESLRRRFGTLRLITDDNMGAEWR